MHHHDGRMYYQQYFKWLDDFFGFTEDEIRTNNSSSTRKRVGLNNMNNKGRRDVDIVKDQNVNE